MPFTVITLKKVPASLRGDLTKWMQEIATGVYVGNFNRRIREELWERVLENTVTGEATMSFSYHNEIGYQFETYRTQREVVNFDGIPLVKLMKLEESSGFENENRRGFSQAAKFKKAKKYSSKSSKTLETPTGYVVIDIETDGLNSKDNRIIEIGAVKVINNDISYFNRLIEYGGKLPEEIRKLTGISSDLLDKEGYPLNQSLKEFIDFIGRLDIVGYGVDFDLRFLNLNLKLLGLNRITNKVYDLMRYVKKEKMMLKDYKLSTVLLAYEINSEVPHRALEDAKLIYELSTKVNKFLEIQNRK